MWINNVSEECFSGLCINFTCARGEKLFNFIYLSAIIPIVISLYIIYKFYGKEKINISDAQWAEKKFDVIFE